MKAKKIVLALAALTVFSSFAACTDTDNRILFNDYWEKNSTAHSTVDETLTYKVTHEKGAGLDVIGYTLTYGVGTYVTTLKSKGNGYVYTTSLTMPVTYQYGNDAAETLTDTVTSEVVFARSNGELRPVSSTKSVVSHTPNNSVGVDKKCYSLYDFSIATSYPTEGQASSTITYKKYKEDPNTPGSLIEDTPVVKSSTFDFGDEDYSCLDNEQLLLALRAISTSTTTGSFKAYNPFVKSMQKIDFSFQTETSAKFTYKLNEKDISKDIAYRPVTLSIDDTNPGATQTAWIASVTNPNQNEHRNVMLKLVTPLSYSLGDLVYELVSITRA